MMASWTMEQLDWASTPAVVKPPHRGDKIIGRYTDPEFQRSIYEVPNCVRGGEKLRMSPSTLADGVLAQAHPHVGAVADLGRGQLKICCMQGPRDRGTNPGDHEYNCGRTWIRLYRIGTPAYNVFAWERPGRPRRGSTSVPDRAHYHLYALPEAVRIEKRECPAFGVTRAMRDNWRERGTPIRFEPGACRNEWDIVSSGEGLRRFGTTTADYRREMVRAPLLTVGKSIPERMAELKTEHQDAFARVLVAALYTRPLEAAV